MRLHLLGGVDTVTGSQHILEANGRRVLRDCGLFQGRRAESRAVNRELPFEAPGLEAMVLSHAHLDHCGNMPTLAARGFGGPVHATSATAELCGVMLRDAAHIQEQDAAYLNQKASRRGLEQVEPLYTLQDAERALKLLRGCAYGPGIEIAPGIAVEFDEAGHILGAALTTFTIEENSRRRRVGFAVDLGRKDLPLLRDPAVLQDIDVLVLESTYGDRVHDDARDAESQLCGVVDRTHRRGGKVLIPSFALERAQEILYHLAALYERESLPQIPVYVDSPMATAITRVFVENREYLDDEYRALRAKIGRIMMAPWVRFVASVEESKALTSSDKPCIVIAGSGMCEHGRILHHLKHGIGNPANSIVMVGFQAAYTLGRRLVEQQKEVRIFGDMFRREAEVAVLNAFSAHADRNELVEYVRAVNPGQTWLVHGEPDQRQALAEALRASGAKDVHVPAKGEVVEL